MLMLQKSIHLNARYLDFINIKIQHIHRTQQHSNTQLHIFCPSHVQNKFLWQKAFGDNVGSLSYSSLLFYPYVLALTGLFAGQVRVMDLHRNLPGKGLFPQTKPLLQWLMQNNRTDTQRTQGQQQYRPNLLKPSTVQCILLHSRALMLQH